MLNLFFYSITIIFHKKKKKKKKKKKEFVSGNYVFFTPNPLKFLALKKVNQIAFGRAHILFLDGKAKIKCL